MKIYIQMKAAGKRKSMLSDIPYELPEPVITLRDFLSALVKIEVERYNQKGTEVQVVPFLTKEEVEDQASAGKVAFGSLYSDKKADLQKAVDNALQCFEDGLVRVFQNDQEIKELEDFVNLKEGDHFTLIRLTFLAGRLW